MKRRDFVRTLGRAGGIAGLGGTAGLIAAVSPGRTRPLSAHELDYGPLVNDALRLVVLHTNDTHSRMDPWTAAALPAWEGPPGAQP